MTAKIRQTTTKTRQHTYLLFVVIILCGNAFGPAAAQPETAEEAFEATILKTTNDHNDLDQYLETQTVLIGTLREYIRELQEKIEVIKSKTNEIKTINDIAHTDVHKYVSNPLNALTILKRFTTDWQSLRKYAENVDSTTEIVQNLTNSRKSLKFPSESDFDEAADNVLRIQGIYQLEPKRLAEGEVNGVKLGSAMSWSDCLEIGRKYVQNGDFTIAKYWMNVALGKLPVAELMKALTMTNDTNEVAAQEPSGGSNAVVENARFEIMEELMATEMSMGNLDVALDIADEMLQLYPKNKNLHKIKAKIEKKLQKTQRSPKQKEKAKQKKTEKLRSDKSVEELLIEQICRETANIGVASASATSSHITTNSRAQDCRLVNGNLPQLTLQPLEVEFLSLDPYIVIYHNVLRAQEINDLQRLIDHEEEKVTLASKQLKFTKLAQKKLSTSLAKRLQFATGHASAVFNEWQVQRWSYEDAVHTEPLLSATTQTQANVLFNLHTPKLGGGIVFPQLEMGIRLPANAVLYWTHLNEYHEYDYRSKQHVCPVVAGAQLTAYSSVRA
ncbi:unnamed protein product [Ceratitis capitata]|uniref:(Mediterranean fruit fly) hypothetical protein n=1 Tax=Ceratitis capitata TaxID=7213 RepID=A0A811U4U7_CERCA|nr:unnamed protein product [Ceratitis capitata]